MKRTKERFGTYHPDDRAGISGLRMFDGEDLGYVDRVKTQMMQQKDWADQQKREKEDKKKMENEEENAYAKQTLDINRMRGMLEDEAEEKRREMLRAIQRENQLLAKQKKMREIEHKKGELEQEYQEIAYSFVPYGEKPDLPPTYEEYAKTKGVISPVKLKK